MLALCRVASRRAAYRGFMRGLEGDGMAIRIMVELEDDDDDADVEVEEKEDRGD